MENEVECFSTPFIDEDSNFNEVALDNFIKKSKLEECGLSYAVVAIMGAQSSGKSTLLNYLFHTNFKEMDADDGICKTTQGIWIARCVGIEPCTIVMDLEGTDGKERGENTTFEKRSALFALAVSDIVLFNLWCKDIGLQHAASRPLLKTIFAVMLKLSITPRKTTFMIVIRDKTRTPLIKLEQGLREDIQKIWDSIPKTEAHKNTLLSDYLNVQVVALCSYVDKEEQFKEEVANLRQRFFRSIAPGGLAGDRQRLVPASGFSCSAQQIWEVIKVNKDLDLPSLAVLVATIRCEQIANEKYSSFLANEDWLELEEAVQSQPVSGFGQILSSLIHNCLSSYDKEATDYEESVGHVKRKGLETKLMELVQPSYHLMLEHIQSGTLEDFKQALNITLNEGQAGFAIVARDCKRKFTILFDEKCQDTVIEQANWDSAKIRGNFLLDLDSHLTQVKTAKLSALATLYETRLKEKLCDPVRALLKVGSDDTWPRITNLVSSETRNIVSDFKNSGFEMDEQSRDMISKLSNYPREIVERMAREEVGIVMYRMKERFISLFCYDKDSMPRVWTKKEDILAITKTARSSSLKLLSVLAAIRLDKYNDTIEDTLFSALLDPKKKENLLASHTWEKVPVNKTLITPIECKSLWDRFLDETNYDIIRANASRKANKEETNMEFAKGFVAGVSGAAGVVGVVCAIVL